MPYPIPTYSPHSRALAPRKSEPACHSPWPASPRCPDVACLFGQAHCWPAAAETESHLSRRRRVSCCAVRVPCAFSYPCMPRVPGHLPCSTHPGPKLPVFMRTMSAVCILRLTLVYTTQDALTGSHRRHMLSYLPLHTSTLPSLRMLAAQTPLP